jgi:hypothetical protein
MTHEPDGVALEVEQLLTQGGQGVAELARVRAQQRTQALREAARESVQHTAALTARLEAEKGTARAQLAGVSRPEWWDAAGARQIVDCFATAEQWRDSDPEFAVAADRIRGEMRDRFGIDPHAPGQPGRERTGAAIASPHAAVAAEIAAALADLAESRRVHALAGQGAIEALVRGDGPPQTPQARLSRGRNGDGPERERGR